MLPRARINAVNEQPNKIKAAMVEDPVQYVIASLTYLAHRQLDV